MTMRARYHFAAASVALCAIAACDQKPIIAPAVVVVPADGAPHNAGRYSAADKAMVAVPGESGFVAFGPYAELAPGAYEATFNVSVDGAPGVAGRVDVNQFTPDRVSDVLASVELKSGADQKIPLRFTAAAGPKYEFRVASDGVATIRLLGIVVKKHQ